MDLTLAGHDHIYERTCPVYKKNCLQFDGNGTAWGPVHVVIGNAGYKLSWGANPSLPAYWSTVALEHGFLRCDVNGTVFHCEVGGPDSPLCSVPQVAALWQLLRVAWAPTKNFDLP